METSIAVRHPRDPDVVRSTKARTVLVLGVFAAGTGVLVAGLVPATLAFLLARQARAEMTDSAGYLTGGRALRWGVALAWVGVGLAATALVSAAIVGLVHQAHSGSHFVPAMD